MGSLIINYWSKLVNILAILGMCVGGFWSDISKVSSRFGYLLGGLLGFCICLYSWLSHIIIKAKSAKGKAHLQIIVCMYKPICFPYPPITPDGQSMFLLRPNLCEPYSIYSHSLLLLYNILSFLVSHEHL